MNKLTFSYDDVVVYANQLGGVNYPHLLVPQLLQVRHPSW